MVLNFCWQECNAHIRLQMQQLADSQAVEAIVFLEQVNFAFKNLQASHTP